MAIITPATYLPNWLSPAYNPIVYSVLSTKVTDLTLRYVFDVYVDNAFVARIKQRPNPLGYGMIDVSSIVQGKLDYSQATAEPTNGETTIDYSTGKVYAENPYLSRHVAIKVGEEVYVRGAYVMYKGSDETSVGDPAVNLFSGNTANTSLQTHVWPASLTDHEQQWHMQDSRASGIFGSNPWIRDDSGNELTYDHGVGLAYPLSEDTFEVNGILTRYVNSWDKAILSFINWSPYPNREKRPIYGFRFSFASPTASYSPIDVPMITANGYSQRATATSTIGTSLDAKYDIVHVLAGFNDVMEALNQHYTPTAGWSVTITGYDQATSGSSTFGVPVTKSVRFIIKDYCTDPLYPSIRLSWLNRLGGRDYMNFTAFAEKNTTVTSEDMFQEQMQWSKATPVPVLTGSYPIGKLGIVGGTKPYNKSVDLTYSIESDWLENQKQIDLLESLIASPQIMAYIHDESNEWSDRYPYTVTIQEKSYSTKNIRQTKLVQGKFKINLSMPQKIQTTY